MKYNSKFECKKQKSDIYWISVLDRRAFQWSCYSSMAYFFIGKGITYRIICLDRHGSYWLLPNTNYVNKIHFVIILFDNQRIYPKYGHIKIYNMSMEGHFLIFFETGKLLLQYRKKLLRH